MNEFALHGPSGRTVWRWAGSAIVIVALHAGLIAAGVAWYRAQAPAGGEMPTIMVDMAPAAAAPELQPQDVAPGPEMQQADAPSEPPPEPVQPQQMEEQVPPTPPVDKPVVEAPPEQKIEPTPPPPEPAKAAPEPPKPAPEKPRPKPVHAEVKKKPSETPPAPRTTAPQHAERQGRAAAAPAAGASRAASLSYNQLIGAHLLRFKQYPSSARAANEQGVASVLFTLDRNGRVLGSRLARSSGSASLDAEVLAMVRRAQPFPPFPPEKTGSSDSFSAPVSFLLR